ncbi:hypothetical protein O7626_12655 [Micromonospora sp. WMMD1102]|uniref:hypothetical protein n=1 Tax=Micromonospora sp. WMMD1102 TaxID=3016105 RepID=UPI00241522D6|nr:hypothetical protein [Micromonospora sp. WMMD1102]MDG4786772.1 hypothetical protein [Micromonospora sp. WMMD1102]
MAADDPSTADFPARQRIAAGHEDLPVLSAAVMTHPDRLSQARAVAAGLAPLDAALAVDPEPDGPPSTVRSARLAYAAVAPDATHHLVVQDDVLLPDGFAAAARQSLARQPRAAVSYFVEWGSRTAALVRFAALTGASWVPMVNPYVPTQALALPADVAREFAAFLATQPDTGVADDELALDFLGRAGVPCLVTVPNLVEHDDRSSLIGNHAHGVRLSACLLPDGPGPAGDAAQLTGGVLDVPALLPFLAWTDGTATTIDTTDGSYSTRLPTGRVLAGWGWDGTELTDAYRAALADIPAGGALRAEIGDRHLRALWETAVATGVVLSTNWPESAERLTERLETPLARRALRSMGPGALRTFHDFDLLTGRTEEFAALATAGLLHGAGQKPPT